MNGTMLKALPVVAMMIALAIIQSIPTDGAQTPFPVELSGEDVGAFGTVSYTGSIDGDGNVSDGRVRFKDIRLSEDVPENITCRVSDSTGVIAEAVDIPLASKFYMPVDLGPGSYIVTLIGLKTKSLLTWELDIKKVFVVDVFTYISSASSDPVVTLKLKDVTDYDLPAMTDMFTISGSTLSLSSYIHWKDDDGGPKDVITDLDDLTQNENVYIMYSEYEDHTVRYSSTYIL